MGHSIGRWLIKSMLTRWSRGGNHLQPRPLLSKQRGKWAIRLGQGELLTIDWELLPGFAQNQVEYNQYGPDLCTVNTYTSVVRNVPTPPYKEQFEDFHLLWSQLSWRSFLDFGVLSTNQISDCVNRKCLLIFHYPPQKVFIFKAADYSKPSQLWHSLSSLWSPVVQYNLPTDWLVRSTMCPRIVFVR